MTASITQPHRYESGGLKTYKSNYKEKIRKICLEGPEGEVVLGNGEMGYSLKE